MSSSEIWKSKTSAFWAILSLLLDFGMQIKPRCKLHRIITCADVLPYLVMYKIYISYTFFNYTSTGKSGNWGYSDRFCHTYLLAICVRVAVLSFMALAKGEYAMIAMFSCSQNDTHSSQARKGWISIWFTVTSRLQTLIWPQAYSAINLLVLGLVVPIWAVSGESRWS